MIIEMLTVLTVGLLFGFIGGLVSNFDHKRKMMLQSITDGYVFSLEGSDKRYRVVDASVDLDQQEIGDGGVILITTENVSTNQMKRIFDASVVIQIVGERVYLLKNRINGVTGRVIP